ncbi:NF-kappa-B inhibitor-interacting Ras-like protein 1 [Trichoplax sp. H2]|uniref:Small monomeric GTPase n=1 Tax=Trichoplax adhaerens TaxID=10228 RepID=B3SCL7_TRIAD|nr:hypothetical protein TRIADDRAFT_33304 [Trichoplax adhaerens]EDV19561.1 hypothetical protein TRIADDRAFT_33304 [Trichoplax adhaerens]RDD40644.1 NF-kappa-B inhibitor-interacting Ras-like protein 1 [Trichoplax sp. H2]|eukprot:XP_002117993.1 hypothetical protein TRIADDRAFT_33304 [Trichoplax adhaerens]
MSRSPTLIKGWSDVCVIGDEKVGKTAMIHLLTQGYYDINTKYEPTLEDSYILHVASSLSVDKIKLKLLDTAGSNISYHHKRLPRHFIDQCAGFIIMYSVDRLESFNIAKMLVQEIKSVRKENDCAIIVLGNKTDLIQYRCVSREDLQLLCNEENVYGDEVTVTDKSTFRAPLSHMVDDIFKCINEESERDIAKKRGVVHRKFSDLF